MSHTCVEDGHMEEHELQSWTCEYPVCTKENHIILLQKGNGCIQIPIPSHYVFNASLPPYKLGSSALKHFQHTEKQKILLSMTVVRTLTCSSNTVHTLYNVWASETGAV